MYVHLYARESIRLKSRGEWGFEVKRIMQVVKIMGAGRHDYRKGMEWRKQKENGERSSYRQTLRKLGRHCPNYWIM